MCSCKTALQRLALLKHSHSQRDGQTRWWGVARAFRDHQATARPMRKTLGQKPHVLPKDLKTTTLLSLTLCPSWGLRLPSSRPLFVRILKLDRTAPQNFSLTHLDSSSGNGTPAAWTPRMEMNHREHWPQAWSEKYQIPWGPWKGWSRDEHNRG